MIAGETEKPCTLVLMDDTFHEEDEELRLVLGDYTHTHTVTFKPKIYYLLSQKFETNIRISKTFSFIL